MDAIPALVLALAVAEPTPATSSDAASSAGALRVQVHGPPGCADADAVLAAVSNESPASIDLDASIDVFIADDAMRFELSTAMGSVARRFAPIPVDCGQRVRVLALSIALALESLTSDRTTPTLPVRASPPAAVPPVEPAPEPRATANVRPTWQIAAGAATRLGMLVPPLFVGGLQLRRLARRWGLRVGIAAGASTSTPLGAGRLRVAVATATIDACLRWQLRTANLLACAGIEGGAGFGIARGYQQPRPSSFAVVTPVAGLELGAPLADRVALLAQVELGIPLRRPVFHAGPATMTAWPISPRIGLALAVALGPAAH